MTRFSPICALLLSLLFAQPGCSLVVSSECSAERDFCPSGRECVDGRCVVAPDGDGDGDVDSDVDGDADGDGDGDVDSDVDGDGDTDGDVDGDADGDGDVDGDADADEETTDADADDDGCVAVGHDEDGDGIDDACDNCPSVRNDDQADGDGDGLGDACEWPGRPEVLSRVVEVDPFLGFGRGWTVEEGTWVAGEDSVGGYCTPGGGNAYRDVPLALPFSVETTFVLAAAGPPDTGGRFTGALFSARDEADPMWHWWGCFFNESSRSVELWEYSGMSIETVAATSFEDVTARDAGWRRLRAAFDGVDRLVCTYSDEAGTTESVEAPPSDLWASMDGVGGLRVYNEDVSFLSFVIYQ